MKLKCIVVDDEQLARQLLISYVSKMPELDLVGEAKNAIEAISILRKQKVDLIFLDIQMPDLTGIELVKTLSNKPSIIFTTAYKEYALDGFDLDVADYMLKPISLERFIQGVNKVMDQLSPLNKVVVQLPQIQNSYISIKADHKIYKVLHKDLLYVEGLREYVSFHCKDQKIVSLQSLKALEGKLPSNFLRIHKSFIVNINEVKALVGNQLEVERTFIPIGKSYKQRVLEMFR